ncbi:hypothetical protein B0H19DRAFT_1260183 [Mycena capillaripes]|nr:hypothetical protein B0H19DRAFT_1260183 [Mycena capillaripes]
MASDRFACAVVLKIPELLAYIVDFLDRRNDPKSFLSFSYINICLWLTTPENIPRTASDVAVIRLSEAMDAAPHLRSLVRTVKTPFKVPFLTQIADMRLSHLNELRFSGRPPGAAALSTAQTLVALPSVQTLDSKRKPAQLRGPESHLYALHPCFERHRITSLKILEISPPAVAWLRDPQSPLNVSSVWHLHLFRPSSPALAFLMPARTTIQELRLHATDVSLGRPLPGFPALTKLRIPPARSERLKSIMLATHNQNIAIDDLAPIDALLAGLHLPALVLLEMSVPRRSGSTMEAFEITRAQLILAFSRMQARGVFTVKKDVRWA